MITEHCHKVQPTSERKNKCSDFAFFTPICDFFQTCFYYPKYTHCSKSGDKKDIWLFNFSYYITEMLWFVLIIGRLDDFFSLFFYFRTNS